MLLANGMTLLSSDQGLAPRALRDIDAGVQAGRFTSTTPSSPSPSAGGALLGLGNLLHDQPDRDDAAAADTVTEDVLAAVRHDRRRGTRDLPAAAARSGGLRASRLGCLNLSVLRTSVRSMSCVAASKRIAALGAEFAELLAESLDGSAGERSAAAHEWETFLRSLPAMTHRLVGSLAEVPAEASTGRVRRYPGDRTVLRHKPHRRSGQGVWGTPQRWRKSTEGCRMA